MEVDDLYTPTLVVFISTLLPIPMACVMHNIHARSIYSYRYYLFSFFILPWVGTGAMGENDTEGRNNGYLDLTGRCLPLREEEDTEFVVFNKSGDIRER